MFVGYFFRFFVKCALLCIESCCEIRLPSTRVVYQGGKLCKCSVQYTQGVWLFPLLLSVNILCTINLYLLKRDSFEQLHIIILGKRPADAGKSI